MKVDDRLARLERVVAAMFVGSNGDRGYGPIASRRYACPFCDDGRAGNGFECPTCAGRGNISMKMRATLDVNEIFRENEESQLETRAR